MHNTHFAVHPIQVGNRLRGRVIGDREGSVVMALHIASIAS
jgi:hypothetical protein